MSIRDIIQPFEEDFELVSEFKPAGDQPQAIKKLCQNIKNDIKRQTLLGVTGSGKTFTIANVIKEEQRPTLVIAPNKTLAAQLYAEFKDLFPNNRVSYFVSYYDYYQPEAYIPSTDTFIEKDSAINEEIDKMRHAATRSIIESRGSIVVASVSCIYGLGSPEDYYSMMLCVERGQEIDRDDLYAQLVRMQYVRSDVEFSRGSFRVRGDTVDIFPSDQDTKAIRLLFFGDDLEEVREIDSITGTTLKELDRAAIYPLNHYVTGEERISNAIKTIKQELKDWLPRFRNDGNALEAERLEQRTLYDLELMAEIGFCSGVENYSRHIDGREQGQAANTLLDYFPEDFLVVIDESHVTIPQIRGMYKGDRSRKETLVKHGFRLPSALDNRPLKIEEFWERVDQVIYVSATPGDFELEETPNAIVELINRPTGIVDPKIDIRPALHQVDDLLSEINIEVEKGNRVLVTTLTKKMSEDLSAYCREVGVKARYLHSDIKTIERVEILRGLRRGDFDVLIGINLLREGLDLIEVGLVAILDADKEGFLRSTRSLIQTMGRAARNANGRVVLYADKVTRSMQAAIDETGRRRKIQSQFNLDHNITPKSAVKNIPKRLGPDELITQDDSLKLGEKLIAIPKDPKARQKLVEKLKKDMFDAASKREFELAASIRDSINSLQLRFLEEG